MTDFDDFFRLATGGWTPYPYQRALSEGPWPDLLDVPTGLGKTAAVTLAWLYRRRVRGDEGMPRRLVWCLPMRVLVEQTRANVEGWLGRLEAHGVPGEHGTVAVHTIMGGEPDVRRASWTAHPEQEAVLIGTQDMLLSRALMRGYGMSRYQWPIHYALLHNDSLWIFDEVQLMGPAIATSAQLEAFRRDLGLAAIPARSTWISATLREEWLDTVDFRPWRQATFRSLALSDEDRVEEAVARRVRAPKTLGQASAKLDDGSKKGSDAYIRALAEEILATHGPGDQTLVILNRVDRAQDLYSALGAGDSERLLLHARFRAVERRAIEECLQQSPGAGGRIVVATQAVEAGIDLDSRVLFTELAPWPSLVQRFGRCNRAGSFDDARVFWIDLDEQQTGLATPYSSDALAKARKTLASAPSAAPAELPPVTDAPEAGQVLRRRDLLSLFNTDPDLSGFDVDVSPYIRDTDSPLVQVFWRDTDDDKATEQPAPVREELCPVSIAQLKAHMSGKLSTARRKAAGRDYRVAWRLDPLAGDARGGAWVKTPAESLRPGQTVMLATADGGYDRERGFVVGTEGLVAELESVTAAEPAEGFGSDHLVSIGRRIPLAEHLADVATAMNELSAALELASRDEQLLQTAAWWHDVGKAHEAFQRGVGFEPGDPEGPWAKSAERGRPRYRMLDASGNDQPRPGFRHELASALAWIDHGGADMDASALNLVAYLVAAHHGRVRMGLRALPDELEPPNPETLFARGVWAGDPLPAVSFDGVNLPSIALRLDVMRLGNGEQGPSWSERMQRVLAEHGPFRLAWLESLLRIADWRASAREAEQ